jgi:hypothetical protein
MFSVCSVREAGLCPLWNVNSNVTNFWSLKHTVWANRRRCYCLSFWTCSVCNISFCNDVGLCFLVSVVRTSSETARICLQITELLVFKCPTSVSLLKFTLCFYHKWKWLFGNIFQTSSKMWGKNSRIIKGKLYTVGSRTHWCMYCCWDARNSSLKKKCSGTKWTVPICVYSHFQSLARVHRNTQK